MFLSYVFRIFFMLFFAFSCSERIFFVVSSSMKSRNVFETENGMIVYNRLHTHTHNFFSISLFLNGIFLLSSSSSPPLSSLSTMLLKDNVHFPFLSLRTVHFSTDFHIRNFRLHAASIIRINEQKNCYTNLRMKQTYQC